MRWPSILVLGTTIATTIAAAAIFSATPRFMPLPSLAGLTADDLYMLYAERVLGPNPTPEIDALAAARQGEFGLITCGGWGCRWGYGQAFGLTCGAPDTPFDWARFRAEAMLFAYDQDDMFNEPRDLAWGAYAMAYNRALAAHPDFPQGDLCRSSPTAAS